MANRIIQGAMRFNNISFEELEKLIIEEVNAGIVYFDHADIYGRKSEHTSEELFGQVIARNPWLKEKIIVQTKCSIVPTSSDGPYYDSTKEHIIKQVNESLEKMNLDHIDYLLLHRPDALMDVAEVADAFDMLQEEGKVLHFGVSNFSKAQIKYLQKNIHQKIEVNQIQMSLCHTNIIDSIFYENMDTKENANVDTDLFYYCKDKNIELQCWSPFQFGFFEGIFIDNEKFPKLNSKLQEIADKYETTKNAIAVAWLLRLGKNISVISGSTSLERTLAMNKANVITLSRKEWYELYRDAGHILP